LALPRVGSRFAGTIYAVGLSLRSVNCEEKDYRCIRCRRTNSPSRSVKKRQEAAIWKAPLARM
jgi:hypothetical protein